MFQRRSWRQSKVGTSRRLSIGMRSGGTPSRISRVMLPSRRPVAWLPRIIPPTTPVPM